MTMNLRLTITILFLGLFMNQSIAQEYKQRNDTTAIFINTIQAYQDSLLKAKEEFKVWKYEGQDTLSNPYFYRLFFQNGLSDNLFKESIGSLDNNDQQDNAARYKYNYINNLITSTYAYNPTSIKNYLSSNIKQNDAKEVVMNTAIEEVQPPKKSDKTLQPVINQGYDSKHNLVVKRPNFWTFKGNASLQFMQAYFSDNWYKGGDNNNTMLATCNIHANYDNKQGFIWTNHLEMKIGFQNSKGDDLHHFKTHADLIRLTNKFGLQATKRWYYTATLQSWTQFYKGYRANDPKVYSDFMSPFESLLTLGMDYKYSASKFNINVSLSPFAGKFKYCDRKNLVNDYGLKDKHSILEFGSNITTTFQWNIWKDIQWNGRIYYFTDYDKSQIEWENTINLRINKYLTTKVFLYPRFDDSVTRTEDHSYFQFQETLSLGVDINF